LEKNIDNSLKEYAKKMPRVKESEDVFKPLEQVVPKKWRNGFMFMGKYTYRVKTLTGQTWNVADIYDYKHGITRQYIHISPSGACFCNSGDNVLKECPCHQAIDDAFQDIEKYGGTRETAYDENYKSERNKALKESGYTIFEVSPGKVKKINKEKEKTEEY